MLIGLAVAVVIIAVVAYVVATREKYDVPIPVPIAIPPGFSPAAAQMLKQIQELPHLMFYINESGMAELSSPVNLIKTVNAITNIQLALGCMVTPSFTMGVPTSIPSEYNGALVISMSSEEPLVFPFGKTLALIADDMENLYKRIPSNRVPLDLDLQQLENSN